MIFWASKGLGNSVSLMPSVIYTACLTGQLPSTCAVILGGHSMCVLSHGLGSSIILGPPLQLRLRLHQHPLRASAAVHDPFMSLKPVPSGKLLPIIQFCFQLETKPRSPPLNSCFCVVTLSEYLEEDLTSVTLVSYSHT